MSDAAIEKTNGRFSIKGEMSFKTVNGLLAQSSALGFDGTPLYIDLDQVTRADSSGLALLVEWTARARRGDTKICFLNMPGQMREIARMTEVDTFLPMCESRSALSDGQSRFEASQQRL